MSATGKDRLLQFYEDVANKGDLDLVEDFCTEDFVDHEEFPGIPRDREGVRQFFTMLRGAFPDLHMTPESVVEEGDRVMARFRMTGTHEGEFLGVPASGRHVEIEGYDEVRLVEGRACEHWGAMDAMALMQQIGAQPSESPAG